VESRPDFDVGHFNLGIINYQERNLDEAKKNYEEVLKINPADSSAKENLSAICIIKNDYEEAVDLLLEVINSSPEDDMVLENAYYNIGVAYLRLKKYKDALDAFEAAISIEPWDMAAYVNAAILSEELGQKDKAIKYWQKYDRLLPVNKRKKEIQDRLKKLGVKPAPVTTAQAAAPAAVSPAAQAPQQLEKDKGVKKPEKEVKK
jgi:tetratricopeptide (TPR) repeat protein